MPVDAIRLANNFDCTGLGCSIIHFGATRFGRNWLSCGTGSERAAPMSDFKWAAAGAAVRPDQTNIPYSEPMPQYQAEWCAG